MQSSEHPEWDVEFKYAQEVLGQDTMEATFTANRVCIMMGAALPPQAPLAPKPQYSNARCEVCGLPYPPHSYKYVGHDMVWPEGVTLIVSA